MTTPHSPFAPYTCDQFAGMLADLLERGVDEDTRAAMESHALACADCGPLVADLRKLRIDAANMPVLVPTRDLWAGIAERIETPVVEITPGSGERDLGARRGAGRRAVWLGLAAAGLVAVTATVTRELTKRTIAASTPAQVASTNSTSAAHDRGNGKGASAAGAPGLPSSTASEASAPETAGTAATGRASAAPSRARLVSRLSPEQTYDTEIAQLRAVLEARRPQLDSSTIAVVEKNLKIIDDAIAQCRVALKKDPASRFLLESLNDAMDNKVQLLRTAVALPSRS